MAQDSANLWVLDFLLEADGLDDTLIKHFHDVNVTEFEELPPNTQARLMLRVLRDAPSQPTGISEAALGALNMLKNLAAGVPEKFTSFAKPADLRPSDALFTEVKTELVLKAVREGGSQPLTSYDHPKVLLDTYFPPPDVAQLNSSEIARRDEILEGLKSLESTAALLEKYSVHNTNNALLSFVASAREALGPNMLRLVERDFRSNVYNPYTGVKSLGPPQAAVVAAAAPTVPGEGGKGGRGGRGQGPKRKRSKVTTTTEDQDAAGMLTNLSQSSAVLAAAGGQDPLAGAIQSAEGAAKLAEGAQVVTMDVDANGTPQQQLGMPEDGLMQNAGLEGATPPATETTEKLASANKSGSLRRRNGRWTQEETNFLIGKVREEGKGKWKKILEMGLALNNGIFQNRSQVDLKDKWRNLERQGVVGPHDLPLQAQGHGGHPMANLTDGAQMPDAFAMAQSMGLPPEQYLQAFQQQALTPEMLQQHHQLAQLQQPQLMTEQMQALQQHVQEQALREQPGQPEQPVQPEQPEQHEAQEQPEPPTQEEEAPTA